MNKIKLFLLTTLVLLVASSAFSQGGIVPGTSRFVRRAADGVTCNASRKGHVYFNTVSNTQRNCNGTAWADAGGGGGEVEVGVTPSDGTADTILKTDASGEVNNATGITQPTGKTLTLTSQAAADEPLRIVAHATQSGDLVEMMASDGTTYKLRVTSAGIIQGDTASQALTLSSGIGTRLAFDSGSAVNIVSARMDFITNGGFEIRFNGGAGGDLSADVESWNLNLGQSAKRWNRLYVKDGVVNSLNSRVAGDVTNNTTTPAAITGLSATLIASGTYKGTIVLHYNQSVAADGFRFDLDGGTATVTDLRLDGTIHDSTSNRFLGQTTALATDLTDTSTATNARVVIEFTITVNAAGTLIPRFALEAASTGLATVFRGSSMLITNIP